MQVQPLNDEHDRKDFDCGEPALNNWLKQMARQHKVKEVSSTFVTHDHAESVEILGFYSISLAEMLNIQLPAQRAKRLRSRVPVFRRGRLATALTHLGKRIVEFMHL
jgi:hypothetical protein